MYRSPKTTSVERSRLIAYIPLFIAAVMFWAIQEQGATILANYADKRTQLNFAGLEINPAWFQSLNPLFIITLAPVFAWLWIKLGKRQPCRYPGNRYSDPLFHFHVSQSENDFC